MQKRRPIHHRIVKHTSRLVYKIIGGVLGLATFIAVMFVWRLANGPIPVDFLADSVEKALNKPGSPVALAIKKTALAWNEHTRIVEIQAYGIQVSRPGGSPIARIPALGVQFKLTALLQGQFIPASINIIEPKLKIIRNEDGRLALNTSAQNEDDQNDGAALAFIKTILDANDDNNPWKELEYIMITRALLGVEDHQLNLLWKAREVNVLLHKKPGGFVGKAHLSLVLPGQDLVMSIDTESLTDTGGLIINGFFSGLNIARVAQMTESLKPAAGFNIDLEGRVTLRLTADMAVDRAHALIQGKDGSFKATPTSTLAPIRQFKAEASVGEDGKTYRLDKLFMELRQGTVEAKATLRKEEARYAVEGEASIALLPANFLRAYWPAEVAPNPREWVMENISAGLVEQASARLSATLKPDAEESFQLNALEGAITANGVTAHYFGSLPPIEDGVAQASFNADIFSIAIKSGRVGLMKLQPGQITITGLSAEDQRIEIKAAATGPVSEALRILDSAPLGYATKVGLDPAQTDGKATVETLFEFPLLMDLPMEVVTLKAAASLSDVSVKNAVADWDVTRGNVTLDVTPQRMVMKGKAFLAGVPLNLNWQENFDDGAAYATRLNATGQLTDKDLLAFGLDFHPYISGVTAADITYTRKNAASPATIDIHANLDRTVFTLSALDFSEPGGRGATLDTQLRVEQQKLTAMPKFSMKVFGLVAQGSGQFGKTSDFQKLSLPSVKGNGTDTAVVWERKGAGHKITADGKSLNLAPFMGDDTPPPPEELTTGPRTPLEFSLSMDSLTVRDGKTIYDVASSGVRDTAAWQKVVMNAWTQGKKPILVNYLPLNGAQELTIESSDAGTVLALLGVTDSIQGGLLSVQGTSKPTDPDDTVIGTANIKDFDVHDAPALAKLLNAMSFQGLGEFLQGDGTLRFDGFSSKFRWDKEGISFAEGKTSGSALGLTFEGRLDLKNRTANMQGTIVPIHGINNFISSIPILGAILTGGKGQGVFAATYTIKGPLRDPEVFVNPLAALAPGFLRNLFFMSPSVQIEE